MSAPDVPPACIPSVSALQRPLIYQHEFTAREDLLSMLLSRSDFDVIKGGHFEGAIHVVFLLLLLTTIRLGAQSLWEHSEVAGQVLSLPTCFLQDAVFCTVVFFGNAMFCWTHHLNLRLFARRWISESIYFCFYAILQSTQILVPIVLIKKRSSMSPLITASLMIFLLINSLKMHSYFATNRLLFRAWSTQDNISNIATTSAVSDGETVPSEVRTDTDDASAESTPTSPNTPRKSGLRERRRPVTPREEITAQTPAPVSKSVETKETPTRMDNLFLLASRVSNFASELAHSVSDARKTAADRQLLNELKKQWNEMPTLDLHRAYVDLMQESRVLLAPPSHDPVMFPSNVNASDFCYFLHLAPVLVYETSYPRTDSILWWYVAKELAGFFACMMMNATVMSAFLMPIIAGATPSMNIGSYVLMISDLLVPSLIVWNLGFYAFFHCFLNACAEMARFADRNFYQDWWNSTNLDEFWRKWNVPMHEFCHRHLYSESKYFLGCSTLVANLIVFFVSALLHELLFGVSFNTVRCYFFLLMIAQTPAMILSKALKPYGRLGNMNVWLSLLIAQPLIEMFYFSDFFGQNSNFICPIPR